MIYKTIDLCAGIGGIRRGFEMTGSFQNVLSAEIDEAACKTYEHLFGENPKNDLTSEEFLSAKNTAKVELDVYVNSSDYRTEEQAFLASAIADGKNTIDSATDISAVNTALANAKATIDEIKTDSELTAEELAEVEMLVNEQILENNTIITDVMTPDEARAKGAMALFGEKYGSSVRVVSMGDFSMVAFAAVPTQRLPVL